MPLGLHFLHAKGTVVLCAPKAPMAVVLQISLGGTRACHNCFMGAALKGTQAFFFGSVLSVPASYFPERSLPCSAAGNQNTDAVEAGCSSEGLEQ